MTGWERENRGHFDGIVADYDSIRPQYPDALFADLFAYAGGGKGGYALEIGAGTGKATLPFLQAGYDVTAAEIGENMATLLRERFSGRQDFRVVVAPFEEAEFARSGFDLLYAATAFHWVDASIGCPKAYDLLRSGGTFALFRYTAQPSDGDALYDEIQALYEIYYHKPYVKPVRVSGDEFLAPQEVHRGFRFTDMRDYGFTDIQMKLYDASRVFTAAEYKRMLDTFSDHKKLPDGDREALYEGINSAILRHGGHLKVEYTFQLYMGRKP